MANAQGSFASYRHRQRAPWCLLLYFIGLLLLALSWALPGVPPIRLVFPLVGGAVLLLAASFHHLTVEDEGDRLAISFGPLPLFRRSVRYDDIQSIEVGQTTPLEGWGIHASPRGGWVWNLWGRQCVVLKLRRGVLRVGSDEAEQLAAFLRHRAADLPGRTKRYLPRSRD